MRVLIYAVDTTQKNSSTSATATKSTGTSAYTGAGIGTSAGTGISTTPNPQELYVEISDTGCGVSPEDALRLFTMFDQGHSKKPGSGVGLALSQRIAALMGGKIEVQSPYVRTRAARIAESPMASMALATQTQTETATAAIESDIAEAKCQGLKLHFTLPFTRSDPPQTPVAAAAAAAATVISLPPNLKILVAEDEPMNQLVSRLEYTTCVKRVHYH